MQSPDTAKKEGQRGSSAGLGSSFASVTSVSVPSISQHHPLAQEEKWGQRLTLAGIMLSVLVAASV